LLTDLVPLQLSAQQGAHQGAGVKLRGFEHGLAVVLQAQRRVPAQGDLVCGRGWLCGRFTRLARQVWRGQARDNRGVTNFCVQEPEQAGLHEFFFDGGAQYVLYQAVVRLRTGKNQQAKALGLTCAQRAGAKRWAAPHSAAGRL
jgi:hypothetical protein